MVPAEIRVSAVVLTDGDGRVLLVRKRGTSALFNPGGKPEPGESPAECAVREVFEELGVELDPGSLIPLGRLRAPAAGAREPAQQRGEVQPRRRRRDGPPRRGGRRGAAAARGATRR